jgi:DNA-binding MarR family transcriptional regulator
VDALSEWVRGSANPVRVILVLDKTPATTSEIAHAYGAPPESISRTLGQMRRRGLVQKPTTRAGRGIPYSLTSLGRAVVDKLRPVLPTISIGLQAGEKDCSTCGHGYDLHVAIEESTAGYSQVNLWCKPCLLKDSSASCNGKSSRPTSVAV